MRQSIDAYLDIETTGLFVSCDDITVIGIYLYNSGNSRLIQLVGAEATGDNLLEALEGVSTIFTYNGSRFDLPFIYAYLGVDLTDLYQHHDLMYDCWRENLYGGFKAVEVQLGIPRQLKDIGGFEAIMLWWKYQNHNDQDALALLLEYNREDVINLKALREKLFPEAD
jgi:uncharacterized protein YprB with RNaseH-like and TPR domain